MINAGGQVSCAIKSRQFCTVQNKFCGVNYLTSKLFGHLIKRTAFTLAEVLITLGIISVVAALTIPQLISGYKKLVVETGLKKYHSILSQMVMKSETDNGSAINWEWEISSDRQTTDAFFDKYFLPYIQVVDKKTAYTPSDQESYYMGYDSEGGELSWKYKNLHNGYWRQLSDGGAILFSFSPDDHRDVYYGNFTVILPTGTKRTHLIEGKDVFVFGINNVSGGNAVTVFPQQYQNWSCNDVKDNETMFINRCKKADYSGAGIYPAAYCTMLIYCNNWKIPKNYPIKF